MQRQSYGKFGFNMPDSLYLTIAERARSLRTWGDTALTIEQQKNSQKADSLSNSR